MSTPEQKKLFRKHKITARKHNGDDAYSWAVFQGTQPRWTGLTRSEVDYYKILLLQRIEAKEQAQ